MFTSDTDTQRKQISKTGFNYLLVSIFCALLGAIYEHFSHGVYSYYMIYAFALPLVGGALPMYAMARSKLKCLPGRLALNLYNAGIAAFTVGSILKGVIDIYGTANKLLIVYPCLGIAFSAAGLLVYLFSFLAFKKSNESKYI